MELSPEKERYRHLIAGGIAGTLAAAITCPLDVLKTRVHSGAVPTTLGGGFFASGKTFVSAY